MIVFKAPKSQPTTLPPCTNMSVRPCTQFFWDLETAIWIGNLKSKNDS